MSCVFKKGTSDLLQIMIFNTERMRKYAIDFN